MIFWTLTILYLLAVNLLAYAGFLRDKQAAIAGRRRIPEDRLLAIAFLGGSLGAKLAQRVLRHKIRSEPFRSQLNGIVAVQCMAIAAVWLLWLQLRG